MNLNTMRDFHNFGGTMHCLSQRLKSTFFEIFRTERPGRSQKSEKFFKKKVDYTMSSITGINGLEPTLNIIKHTKKIVIANKESIICG